MPQGRRKASNRLFTSYFYIVTRKKSRKSKSSPQKKCSLLFPIPFFQVFFKTRFFF